MGENEKFEFGVKIEPRKEPVVTENSIIGSYWEVERREGKCLLHYGTGAHGGKVVTFEVPMWVYDNVESDLTRAEEVAEEAIETYFKKLR